MNSISSWPRERPRNLPEKQNISLRKLFDHPFPAPTELENENWEVVSVPLESGSTYTIDHPIGTNERVEIANYAKDRLEEDLADVKLAFDSSTNKYSLYVKKKADIARFQKGMLK